MLPYIAEFLGTMILIILGDGVVANVNLNKSGMKGAGAVQITFAWGLAVLLPAFIFGEASGASFNPALTIALAVDGSFAWSMVPGYIIAQIAGAFVGGCIVYLLFKGQFDATEDPGTKLGVFCTGPSIANTGLNIFSEAVGTFILVFAIKGIGNVTGLSTGVDKLFVFGIIVSVGMSLGGPVMRSTRQEILDQDLHTQYFRLKEKVIQTSDTVWLYRSSDQSSEQSQQYYCMEQFRGKNSELKMVMA